MDDIVLVAGGVMVASLFIILGVSELLLSMQQGGYPLPPGSTPGMCHTALQGYMPVKYARHTMKNPQTFGIQKVHKAKNGGQKISGL